MKKLLGTLWTAFFLLSTFTVSAAADLIDPPVIYQKGGVSPVLILLIAVAVVVAALIIWRARKRK